MSSPEFIIRPFDGDQTTADEVAVRHLEVRQAQVKAGENEFRTDIHQSRADLQGMQSYYIEPGGNFWIATQVATGAIAGFVGLRRDALHEGTLKRMAVLPQYRGYKLGQQLGCALIVWAADQNISRISLTTGKDELARTLIYEPLGFAVTGYDPIHRDYLMALDIA